MTRLFIEDARATKDKLEVKIKLFGGTWFTVLEKDLKKLLRHVPRDKRLCVPLIKRLGYAYISNLKVGDDVPLTKKEKLAYKRKRRLLRRKMRFSIEFRMPVEKDIKDSEGLKVSRMLADLLGYDKPEIHKIHEIRENRIEIEWGDREIDWAGFKDFLEWFEQKDYILKVTGIRRIEK